MRRPAVRVLGWWVPRFIWRSTVTTPTETAPTGLSSIVEVVELQAHLHDKTARINAYLAAGWVLLATYTEGDLRIGQTQRYCLGWRRESGDVVHPGLPETEYTAFGASRPAGSGDTN